jgi:hypothetical protein
MAEHLGTELVLCALNMAAHARVRRQPAQPETMPLEAALNVGGKKVEFRGQGQCKAARQASIYDIPAALAARSRVIRKELGSFPWTLAIQHDVRVAVCFRARHFPSSHQPRVSP